MTVEDRNVAYKLLAAILNMSNIRLEKSGKDDNLSVTNLTEEYLNNAAALLNLNPLDLKQSLLMRTINVAGTEIT